MKDFFPKDMRSIEIKKELNGIKEWEERIKRKDLKYETNRYKFYFRQFETRRSFGDSIYNGKISLDEVEMEQTNLLENIVDFSNKSRPRLKKDKDKTKYF